MAGRKSGMSHLEVYPHEKEGFSVVHHQHQNERGHYKEPKTHILKHHGELMDHLHEHLSKHGPGKGPCKFCEADEAKKVADDKSKKFGPPDEEDDEEDDDEDED